MLRIGLISEQRIKTKKSFWNKYTTEILLNKNNPFELVAVTVPFSEQQLQSMNERKKSRVLEKAVKTIKAQDIKKILLSPILKECMPECDEICNGYAVKKALFPKWAYICVKRFAEKCNVDLLNAKLCIRAGKWDRISESLVEDLCYDTKNLVICTEELGRAKAFCERFMEENGMHIKLANVEVRSVADVVIDVDMAQVRIGRDLVVDGAAPEFELGEFGADVTEVAGCVGEFVGFDGKLSFFSGKKKLTL